MESDSSRKILSVADAVLIILGVVIGAGIFKTPSLVADSSGSEGLVLLLWAAGGAISLIGALCYAELSSTYPHAGGDYHYLNRAFGSTAAFLFAWARMAVIQTGSIAMLAFLIGDYATGVFSLGAYSASYYAALTVVFLTGINIAGIGMGKWMQRVLIAAIALGMVLVVVAGLAFVSPEPASLTSISVPNRSSMGRAMIFVLLTYGGWNEAAYLSSEVRGTRRNMLRVLLYSIGVITAIYLVFNFVLLKSLGLATMSQSEVVAADLMRRAFGENGARFISLLISVAVLSTINATIITGARTNYAVGRDFSLFGFLGRWQERGGTPVNALLFQGAVALMLVILGTGTRSGFVMMVEYTAPVFWFFFLLVGASLFVLRRKEPRTVRPFGVPLYPLTPALFCTVCLYMLQSSLVHTGRGALIGVAVLLVGMPLLLVNGRFATNKERMDRE